MHECMVLCDLVVLGIFCSMMNAPRYVEPSLGRLRLREARSSPICDRSETRSRSGKTFCSRGASAVGRKVGVGLRGRLVCSWFRDRRPVFAVILARFVFDRCPASIPKDIGGGVESSRRSIWGLMDVVPFLFMQAYIAVVELPTG